MASQLTRLEFDEERKKMIVSATSTGLLIVDGQTLHHRFTKLYIDTVKTFNCSDSPSRNAISIDIDDKYISTQGHVVEHDGLHYDGDLWNLEIDFDDIYLSEDVLNDIIFIWLEENEYDVNFNLHGEPPDWPRMLFEFLFSETTFYSHLLDYIKINSEDCCKTNCSDVNFMLAWNGFSLAMSVRDYQQMVYYWNILHYKAGSKSGKCNCNR